MRDGCRVTTCNFCFLGVSKWQKAMHAIAPLGSCFLTDHLSSVPARSKRHFSMAEASTSYAPRPLLLL